MIVYTITNTKNGKQYVGMTYKSAARRWRIHCTDSMGGSEAKLHRDIRKYGQEVFRIVVVENVLDRSSAQQLERLWIERLGTAGNGYNGARGSGKGGSRAGAGRPPNQLSLMIEASKMLCRQQSIAEVAQETGRTCKDVGALNDLLIIWKALPLLWNGRASLLSGN